MSSGGRNDLVSIRHTYALISMVNGQGRPRKKHTNSDWSTIGASTHFGLPMRSQNARPVGFRSFMGEGPSGEAGAENLWAYVLLLLEVAMANFFAERVKE